MVSDSAGCINIVSVREGVMEVTEEWKAHDYEAWIAAFDYHDTNTVYTGNKSIN